MQITFADMGFMHVTGPAITNTGKTAFSAVFYISPMVAVHVTNRLRVAELLEDRANQFELHCDLYETGHST